MCMPSAHMMSQHVMFCIVCKNLETEHDKGLGTQLHHYCAHEVVITNTKGGQLLV